MTRIITRADTQMAHGPLPRVWRDSAARLGEAAGARTRAAAMLLNARAQAREIIVQAQATAQEVARAEQQQAWESGYATGMGQARQEMALQSQRLAALITNAAIDQAASLRNQDGELLALAVAMTRAVLRHELETAPETIMGVARAVLAEMRLDSSVLLRVHPADAAVLRDQLPSLGLPPTIHASIVADATLAPGGCVVESGGSRVDGRIETLLERMESLLHEYL